MCTGHRLGLPEVGGLDALDELGCWLLDAEGIDDVLADELPVGRIDADEIEVPDAVADDPDAALRDELGVDELGAGELGTADELAPADRGGLPGATCEGGRS